MTKYSEIAYIQAVDDKYKPFGEENVEELLTELLQIAECTDETYDYQRKNLVYHLIFAVNRNGYEYLIDYDIVSNSAILVIKE